MKRAKAEKIRKGIDDKIRKATVDMEWWANFWGFTVDEYEEFLDMAIEALEQPDDINCKNCIRCKVMGITNDMEWWANFWGFTVDEYEEFLDMAIEALEQPDDINCKNCIRCKVMGITNYCYCEMWNSVVEPCGYCNYGERKE